MKLRNILKKVKNFKLNNEWLVVEPGEVGELPASVLINEPGLEAVDIEPKKAIENAEEKEIEKVEENIEKVEDKSEEEIEIYTKTGLKKLNKEEQIDLLKKYDISDEEIKLLSTEKDRVKRLLKLQE